MAKKKNNELPKWLVYKTDNELDVTATLDVVPEQLDKTLYFFREVPEWFEAGPDNLDELRGTLTAIDNMPEEERKKHTPEEIQKMRNAIERMISFNEMMGSPGLTENQKEVLRCICYWISLEAMNSIPLTPEDEEALF